MQIPDSAFEPVFDDHRGARQHRFMESADINAAFRALFNPLRTNIRRGLSSMGQVYAIEMDACVPGALLYSSWVPPGTRGLEAPDRLEDAARRRALFDRLLAEPSSEALFAYVCERPAGREQRVLYLEIASADAHYAAEYPICAGHGRHWRDLLRAPHRRLDPCTLA